MHLQRHTSTPSELVEAMSKTYSYGECRIDLKIMQSEHSLESGLYTRISVLCVVLEALHLQFKLIRLSHKLGPNVPSGNAIWRLLALSRA